MPHEVFPIKGQLRHHNTVRTDDRPVRRSEDVAKDIKAVYDDVEIRGGEIVDGHVISGELVGSPYFRSADFVLYLVAKFPEQPKHAD